MEAEKVLVFKVTDSSYLKEGIVKVIQGSDRYDFILPKVVVSLPEEPASRLEKVATIWKEIFPENPLTNIETEENGSRLVVRGKVRSPVRTYRRGAYGIRSWMFVEEKISG